MAAEAETEAMRACARGDSHGLEYLMDCHYTRALRVGYLLLGDHALAEDATQESFVRAWTALRKAQVPEAFLPWLLRIVVNQARDALRRQARHPALSLDTQDGEAWELPAAVADPLEQVERGEMRAVLWQALRQLTPHQREAVVLRYFNGDDAPTIAKIVECRPEAARQRIHDGLRALERIISAQFPWLAAAYQREEEDHA